MKNIPVEEYEIVIIYEYAVFIIIYIILFIPTLQCSYTYSCTLISNILTNNKFLIQD